jgi:DNA/RNA-binding domain of Phe-tRNA-synthetase-like protein
LRIEPELASRLRLGVVSAESVSAGPGRPELDAAIDRLALDLRQEHAGAAPGAIDALQPARSLYRSFGVDPTKTRPSSEALLRRVLRGDALPRISGPVDLSNLLALRFLLPIGLYDADRLAGEPTARLGAAGESYAGIRKDDVHLEGRLVLADASGPFGNPTSDSLRAAVSPETRRLLLVVFAPTTVSSTRVAEHVAEARATIERHLARAGERVVTSGLVVSG